MNIEKMCNANTNKFNYYFELLDIEHKKFMYDVALYCKKYNKGNLSFSSTVINKFGNIYKASSKGNYDIVKILLKKGSKNYIDSVYTQKSRIGSRTSIEKAVEMGHIHIVKLLIDNGAKYSHSNLINISLNSKRDSKHDNMILYLLTELGDYKPTDETYNNLMRYNYIIHNKTIYVDKKFYRNQSSHVMNSTLIKYMIKKYPKIIYETDILTPVVYNADIKLIELILNLQQHNRIINVNKAFIYMIKNIRNVPNIGIIIKLLIKHGLDVNIISNGNNMLTYILMNLQSTVYRNKLNLKYVELLLSHNIYIEELAFENVILLRPIYIAKSTSQIYGYKYLEKLEIIDKLIEAHNVQVDKQLDIFYTIVSTKTNGGVIKNIIKIIKLYM